MKETLLCGLISVLNVSGDPWNEKDDKVLETAMKRCPLKYEGRSPCVVKVIKKGKDNYHVVCGPEAGQKVNYEEAGNEYPK